MDKTAVAALKFAGQMAQDMPKAVLKSDDAAQEWLVSALRKNGAKMAFEKKDIAKGARILRAMLADKSTNQDNTITAVIIAIAVIGPKEISTQGKLWDFITGIFGWGSGGGDGSNDGGDGADDGGGVGGGGGGDGLFDAGDPCLAAQLRYEYYSVEAAEAADAYNNCLAENSGGGGGNDGGILQSQTDEGDNGLPSTPCSAEQNAMNEAYRNAQDALDDMRRECGITFP